MDGQETDMDEMNEYDMAQFKAWLALATAPGGYTKLREALAILSSEQLLVLQREAKDAYGLKLAGAPVVKFSRPVRLVDAIRRVRSCTGQGLRETRDMVAVGEAPVASFEKAQELVTALRDIGVHDARIEGR